MSGPAVCSQRKPNSSGGNALCVYYFGGSKPLSEPLGEMKTALCFFALCCCVAALPAAETEMTSTSGGALRVVKTVRPEFPVRLHREGVMFGEVRLLAEIDEHGKLADCLITAFTHKEFATEAFNAVAKWKFELLDEQRTRATTIVPMTFSFEYQGTLVREKLGPDPSDYHFNFIYRPCRAADLDHPPKLLHTIPPKYPKALGDQGISGVIAMEFFIDELGRVRMPVPLGDAHPILAGLAATALKLWEFEPPKRRGRPVLVSAMTQFKFEPGE